MQTLTKLRNSHTPTEDDQVPQLFSDAQKARMKRSREDLQEMRKTGKNQIEVVANGMRFRMLSAVHPTDVQMSDF